MKKLMLADGSLGARIRARRKSIGITQADLASAIGVSFQQVQKYEKGLSAISPTRLEQICEILHLPQTFFAEAESNIIGKPARNPTVELQDPEAWRESVGRFLQTGEGRRLIDSYLSIADGRLRTRVLDFIVAIAADQVA